MKQLYVYKILFSCLIIISSQTVKSQTASSIERKVTSLDIGLFGSWFNYERQLAGSLTLNAEVGLDAEFGPGYYLFVPTLRLEPRYYYNFNKRVTQQKRTSNNSANFLSILVLHYSDLFKISNRDNFSTTPSTSIFAKWGLRRSLGEHIDFEFATGAFLNAKESLNDQPLVYFLLLDVRVGYIF